MSRMRITARLRQNADFRAVADYLDTACLAWRIEPPPGKGHPLIFIDLPSGETVRHTIACTPRGSGNPAGAIAFLRRVLRAAGYDPA